MKHEYVAFAFGVDFRRHRFSRNVEIRQTDVPVGDVELLPNDSELINTCVLRVWLLTSTHFRGYTQLWHAKMHLSLVRASSYDLHDEIDVCMGFGDRIFHRRWSPGLGDNRGHGRVGCRSTARDVFDGQ